MTVSDFRRPTTGALVSAACLIAVVGTGCGEDSASVSTTGSDGAGHESATVPETTLGGTGPVPSSSTSTAETMPEGPSPEALIFVVEKTFGSVDPVLFDTTVELTSDAAVVGVGRLATVSPGRDVYSKGEDRELVYSTVFLQLDVEEVMKDDPHHPLGDDVVLERLLPDGVTVEDFDAATPLGNQVLFAARDVTELRNFDSVANEIIDSGERAYSPYLQAVVVDDPGGEPRTIDPSHLGWFADTEGGNDRTFSELVDMVREATG